MIEKYLSPGDKVEIRFAQRMAITDENTERKYTKRQEKTLLFS